MHTSTDYYIHGENLKKVLTQTGFVTLKDYEPRPGVTNNTVFIFNITAIAPPIKH